MPDADTAALPNKTRVRVTDALRGVPEGTAGTIHGVVGLAFPRHLVDFDNGEFVTSVRRSKLVKEGDWDAFQADREAQAAVAAEKAAKTAEAPAEAPAAAEEAEAGGDAKPADDRLAALLARSKAAREKAGG